MNSPAANAPADAADLLYWEDFPVGDVAEFGPRTITREEIIGYAAEFDPQPFHLDEDAARGSMVGGLCASGWHTCCILMRMMCDGFLLRTASMGAPGVEEVRWLAPVRPGNQLTIRRTLLDKRPSQSKPDRGFLRFEFALSDQTGRTVMTMVTPQMIRRRPVDGAR